MAMTTETRPGGWAAEPELLRCVTCHAPLADADTGLACAGCGAGYPVRDGVLVVKDEPAADNRIARDFYNSPLWPKFRFWERFFWVCNGGERRSRDVILRHLPKGPGLRLLDVAIGDGVYTSWLPDDCR